MSSAKDHAIVPIPRAVKARIDAAADAMSEVMAMVNLGDRATEFERALSGLRAVQNLSTPISLKTPPRAAYSTLMQDTSGEHPAYCLMLVYRSDLDAMAAQAMLQHLPNKRPAGYLRNETQGAAALAPLFVPELNRLPTAGQYGATYRPVYEHPASTVEGRQS